jgi:putative oxidoreductase
MATQAVPRPGMHGHLLRNLALWALQIGLVIMFLKAAILKLQGNPMMVQVFDTIGLGQWFRYLTGSLEVIGSIGLLIPPLAAYAAALLAAVMAGAVLAHLTVLGGSLLIPLVLLAAALIVAWGRFEGRLK